MGNEFDQISALPFFVPYMQTWHDETNLKICLGFDIEAHLNCLKKRNANLVGLGHLADPGGYPTLGGQAGEARWRRSKRLASDIYFMGLRGIPSGSVRA